MGLFDRVKTALEKDSRIVTHISDMANASGFSLEHLEALGLTKSDLLKLERRGLAIRAYMPAKEGWRKVYVLIDHSDREQNDQTGIP